MTSADVGSRWYGGGSTGQFDNCTSLTKSLGPPLVAKLANVHVETFVMVVKCNKKVA